MNDQLETCSGNPQEAASREELLQELAHCLKQARESKKMNIEEIALTLKLRTVYLKALESGNWDDMPGEVYALGFLRQYATFLGLDVSESIEQLKTGQYKLTKPLTFPDPPIAPNRTWVIVAALAFVVLFIMFNLFDDGFDDGKTEQRSLPAMEMNEIAPAPDVSRPTANEDGTTAESPTTTSTELQSEISIKAPEAAPRHQYRLTAVGDDVWLQLSTEGAAGEAPMLLKEALLRDGESLTVRHSSPSLLLTCGNPIALQVHIDRKLVIAAGSLGESGKVLRDFRLTSTPQQENF